MNFQVEVISILIVTLVILGIIFAFYKQFKNLERGQKPNRFVIGIVKYVQFIYDFTIQSMGERYGKPMAAYMGTVFIYILLSNWSGLLGIENPTSNWSVTLMLTLISWLMMQIVQIKDYGFSGYLKSFLDPYPVFLLPNIFSLFAPLISMSLRLFGNIVSGSVLMGMLYQFTAWVSNFVPGIGKFNFVSMFLAPILHMYFDIFSGFLQAVIFLALTTILIGVEVIPDEEYAKNH